MAADLELLIMKNLKKCLIDYGRKNWSTYAHVFSDGQHSPEELVTKVKEAGIDIISITDHDTVDGISEAVEAGKKLV